MSKKLGKNNLCWCGSLSKYKNCHLEFDERLALYKSAGYTVPSRELIKNPIQIVGIRESGKINTLVLDIVSETICTGISTAEIDAVVCETTKKHGGTPATLGFKNYQKSVCVSINNQVCHGIPSDKTILADGDIVNVDVSTYYKGYFSDSSRMYCMPGVSEEKNSLVQAAKACVELGLQMVAPWRFMGDMSHAIKTHANNNGYSVVRDIGGHGIGLKFHEEPFVSYIEKPGCGMLMVPGMVFTIEPMINMGSHETFVDEKDGWTVYTTDGKPSAQWEVTVLVTDRSCEVLAC